MRSSEGYAVRIVGRNDLQYSDQLGVLHVFVEAEAKWTDIVVDARAIPESAGRSRADVLDRLRWVFAHNGWKLIESAR